MSGTFQYGFIPGSATDTFVPDQLIAGDLKIVTSGGTFSGTAGATLIRGTVVGRVTSSGNLVPSVATATDGSQVPAGIVVDLVTIGSGGTATGAIYEQGEFNLNYLTYDSSFTAATLHAAARQNGIFVKTNAISGDIV